MRLFIIKRQTDTVMYGIFKIKNTNKYKFVNLSKGHICSCEFDSMEEAIDDMKERQKLPNTDHRKIIEFKEIYILKPSPSYLKVLNDEFDGDQIFVKNVFTDNKYIYEDN